MKKIEEKENIDGVDLRVYELGFHLVPTLPEEGVSGAMDDVRGVLEAAGGLMISEDIQTEVMELAYPMENITGNKKSVFNSAYFGWIKFEIIPESILTIEAEMKKNPNVFRFLIIKTVREDTFEKVSPISKDEVADIPKEKTDKASKETIEISKEKDTKKEISNEKVDKAIDELVVE